ncbi:MAG: hypothetical protein K0S41_2551 [Anaerocolumna sp.]|nr:hypothetical protein [Anaerocolumna sp.]
MKVLMDQDLNVHVVLDGVNTIGTDFINQEAVKVESADINVAAGGDVTGEMGGEIIGGEVVSPKDPILSSWPFVIGISALTIVVGVLLGLLLAKRKIKKGFELYED